MVPTKNEPLGEVPAEVRAFAEEQGVTGFLPAVLTLTRRIFPGAPLRVLVDDDPEIANDRHIVLEVEVAGLDVQQMFEAQRQWTADIFKHCPAIHAPVFRIMMVPPA
jgi:hypothetical protein